MRNTIYITLILGILIFITSFIDIKKIFLRRSIMKKKYRAPRFKLNFLNSKGFNKLIGIDKKNNMKKFIFITEYNKVLRQSKNENDTRIAKSGLIENDMNLSRYITKYYFINFITPFILLIIMFTVSIYFKGLAYRAAIDPYTISTNTSNIINEKNSEALMNKYKNVFEEFILAGRENEFREDIKSFVELNNLNLDDKGIQIYIDSLKDAIKIKQFSKEEWFIAITLSFASIIIINSILTLKYKMVKKKLFDEFNDLEMIALLHIRRKGINVYFIISEMNKYSNYLRPYLTRCLNKYSSEPAAALDNLALEVDDIRFKRFIDILKSAHFNSSDLNGGLLYYQRKLRFEEGFNKKEEDTITDETILSAIQIPLIAAIVFMSMIPLLENVAKVIQKM